jgi:hypothetical protein
MTSTTEPSERRTAGRALDETSWTSVRRDAWRIQLFREQIAEEAQRRSEAAGMRRAVMIGVALGVLGVAGATLTNFPLF